MESRPTWPCATSPSTRSRSRWPTWPRRRSTRTAGWPTSSAASCAPSRRAASPTTRCGSCGRRGSPPALGLELDQETVDARPRGGGAGGRAGGRAPVRGAAPAARRAPSPLRGLRAPGRARRRRRPLLPELEALRGVEQNPYHHLDVHGHTMEVLRAADRGGGRPGGASSGAAAADVRELLAEPLADELTRGGALRFARPVPRPRQAGDAQRGRGRPGAVHRPRSRRRRIVRELCARLRASRRLADYLASLTLHHLRLGFLVHERPLSRRHVYDYLRATEPDSRRRHPAHGRRPARHPGRADPRRRRSTPTSSWPAR